MQCRANMRKMAFSIIVILAFECVLTGRSNEKDDFEKAVMLFENGMYSSAMDILQNLSGYGKDSKIDGYYTLCAQRLETDGYQEISGDYLSRYKASSICEEIRKERALDFFDREMYREAADEISKLNVGRYSQKLRAEYVFKKGYSHYKLGEFDAAQREFTIVGKMVQNDYSAPAAYCMAYVSYSQGWFEEAIPLFETASVDERFRPIARYYIVNCHYELSDFDYVLGEGVALHDDPQTPDDRKMYLARIISEACLVKGDKDSAKKYYLETRTESSDMTRDDYFYAGSLMYAIGDWQSSVNNYSIVAEGKDSLSQIANYQSAFAYLNLKNKVAALQCFKNASSMNYDTKMTEDAMFNYAKLAFDVNGDSSVFNDYMNRYSDKARGELIYSYMALAALSEGRWQAALDAYDKMDVLTPEDRNNYIRANYLRGAELLENGSYRNAIQCFKTVAYFVPKNERVNQLARYALGEAYFKDAQFAEARKQYLELYNASALFGLPESERLLYNLAWSCLEDKSFEQAAKWFEKYVKEVGGPLSEEASLRRADCFFVMKDYKKAAEAYDAVSGAKINPDKIYPYYKSAIANGLAKNNKRKLELLLNVKKAKPTSEYYAEAYFELGKTYQTLRQFAPAVTTLREVYKTVPGSPYAARAMLEIGTIKRNIKDIDGSINSYKTVIEKMPDSPYAEDALMALESMYQSLGSPDKYLEYIDKIGRGGTKTDDDRIRMLFSNAEQTFYTGNYAKTIDMMIAFKEQWPDSPECVSADWYLAESYRNLGDKVHASDMYSKVMSASVETKYKKDAVRNYADINCSIENYELAAEAYSTLLSMSAEEQDRVTAHLGMARSNYALKRYDEAIASAAALVDSPVCGKDVKREAMMIKAKGLLETSRREEAIPLLETLSREPGTSEGAEASYMVILDCFNKGDYKAVEEKCFDFSSKAGIQRYYLAKSFIVLGDSYAEQGLLLKAEATFKSLAKNYTVSDEISSGVQMRLEKLKEMNQK